MAQGPQLPEAAERAIAAQIAERLPAPALTAAMADAVRASSEEAARPSLAESFEVYLLGYEDVVRGCGSLRERLVPTGQWHHQVSFGADPGLFARSQQDDADTWTVQEVVRSDLPERIGRTIAWIDENEPGEADASLLIAPAYFLTAFVLASADSVKVVVVDRPDGMSGIELNKAYDESTFLELLSAQPPVTGLPERRASPA